MALVNSFRKSRLSKLFNAFDHMHHTSDMWTPSRGSATVMVPLIVLFAVLKHHNPAYIPAVLLAALAGKRSFFPPILQPLYRPEAERRLKFNLFILLHLAISFGSFPPYRALRSGMVWYVDEYVQGRRGGQKSWALSGLQATGQSSPVSVFCGRRG